MRHNCGPKRWRVWFSLVEVAASSLAVAFALPARAAVATQGGRGIGEVAAVSGGELRVVDEATGRRVIVAHGAISDPAFSHDGSFVAYMTPGKGGELRVVRSSGGPVMTSIRGVYADAWSSAADELAVSLAGRVELLSSSGAVLRSWSVAEPGALSFSPSGDQLAVASIVHDKKKTALVGRLMLLPVGGGLPRVIADTPDTCQDVAGWTSDGARVLSWQDPQCSASIAADGLALAAVPATGGRPRPLAVSLPYGSWVVPIAGGTVLVNTGRDRVVADEKAVASCDTSADRCEQLPLPKGTSTLDPAVATGKDLLYEIRVSQSVLADRPLDGTLWVGSLSGRNEHRIVAAGEPVADPVPSKDGATVTFVHLEPSGRGVVEVLDVRTGYLRRLCTVAADTFFGELQAATVLAVWTGP